MKRILFWKIESPVKAKKIEVTVSVALVVILFFVWLGIGMYVSVPESARSSLIPMLLMYLVFPLLVASLSVQRIVFIVKNEETDEEPPKKPEENKTE
jgi:uncharacterized Tic20 family protein